MSRERTARDEDAQASGHLSRCRTPLGATAAVLAILLGLLAGCTTRETEVRPQQEGPNADYGLRALQNAAAAAAGKPGSTAAYQQFADQVHTLRPRFDASVEREAELRLMFLALAPMLASENLSPSARVESLGTSVWPAILSVRPWPNELPRSYLSRLCQHELARDCKYVVPEEWSTIIGAVAWRRLHERAAAAYTECFTCQQDPRYAKALATMAERHRLAGAAAEHRKSRVHPRNWPTAGPNSHSLDDVPIIAQGKRGVVELDGTPRPEQRFVDVMRTARARGPVLAIHLRPGERVARLRSLMRDARIAGFTHVDLVVRNAAYPYRPCAYRLALAKPRAARLPVRKSDTIQVLVQRLDALRQTRSRPVVVAGVPCFPPDAGIVLREQRQR